MIKLLPALLLLSSLGFGQILTVEKYNFVRDSLENELIGHADFGFKTKRQIYTVYEGSFDANGAYVAKNWNIMLLGEYEFQKAGGSSFVNDGFAHMRLTLRQKKRLNSEIYGQAQYDVGLGLNRRVLGGIGERYRLLEKDKMAITLKGSLMYENEFWTESINDVATYTNNQRFKSSINFALTKKLHENIYFYLSIYHQAWFNDWFKPRVFTDGVLKFKITNNVSIKSSIVMAYDASPVVDVAGFYYTAKTGLSVDF